MPRGYQAEEIACEQCGRLIAGPRLEALPKTRTCSKACSTLARQRRQRIASRKAARERVERLRAADEERTVKTEDFLEHA